jgi:hypothetical protein
MKTRIRQITWTGKHIRDAAYLLAVGVMALCCCNGDHATEPSPSTPVPLTGTKWKLACAVDVKTGALKEFEPKDCAECYTLVFDSDHTANGHAASNIVWVNFTAWAPIGIGTMLLEYEPDGRIFCDLVRLVTSYSIANTELKFYYTRFNRKGYLLYKLIEQ